MASENEGGRGAVRARSVEAKGYEYTARLSMYQSSIPIEIKAGETLNLRLTARITAQADTGLIFSNEDLSLLTEDTVSRLMRIRGKVLRNDGKPLAGGKITLYKRGVEVTYDGLSYFTKSSLADGDKGGRLHINERYPVLDIEMRNNNKDTVVKTIKDNAEIWFYVFSGGQWARFVEAQKPDVTTTSYAGEFEVLVSEKQQYKIRCSFDENGVASFVDSEWIVPPYQNIKIQIAPMEGYVDEADILKWLPEFAGYKYTWRIPRYPFKIWDDQPDNLLEKTDHLETKINSCNAFTEALLVKTWETVYDGSGDKGLYQWDSKKHLRWMIPNKWDAENNRFGVDEFGPITVAIGEPADQVRMAVPIDDNDSIPPPWTLVQGWKIWDPKPNDEYYDEKGKKVPAKTEAKTGSIAGHSFIIVDVHRETKRLLILESNTAGMKLDGPGFRGLGHIDKFAPTYLPGSTWWESPNLPTWDSLKNIYTHRKLAKLKVTNLRLARDPMASSE